MEIGFLTRKFMPLELAIQHPPWHDARMRVRACGDILFELPQHVHDFDRGTNMRDVAEET